MDKQLSKNTDAERLLALEEQESIFHLAAHRAIEDVIALGRTLHMIKSEDLWHARPEFENWADYLEGYLGVDNALATRWLHVHHIASRLENAGLMLPENESQAVELARAPEDRQVPIWQQLTRQLEAMDRGVTVDLIKRAIVIDEREQIKTEEKPKTPRKAKGVAITLSEDEDEDEEEKEPPPQSPRLSETGEAALDRIRSICGKDIAQAINDGRLTVPQRDLVRWAEQDDETVHNLAFYVLNRWSVTKALHYEERAIDWDTTVENLLTLTRARGGKYAFSYERARFAIETA